MSSTLTVPEAPICTERLLLRRPTEADTDRLFAIFGDPDTQRFNPAGPYLSRSKAEATMQQWLAHWDEHSFGDWAICLRNAPDLIVGFGGLAYAQFGNLMRANLGYRFSTEVWGRGLATEFALAAVRHGFEELGLPEIRGKVRENHTASRRVLEKVGMRQIDLIPDPRGVPASVVYSVAVSNGKS